MFGTNPLSRQELGDGEFLEIQHIFSTIQGEGPFSGRPAIFLRLAGCNLACYFCDTDFESKRRRMTVGEVVAAIVEASAGNLDPDPEGRKVHRTTLVVITGGEPLLQNLNPLLSLLVGDHHFEVQIETAGTVWQDGLDKWINGGYLTIVCSPKTGKVNPGLERNCYDWKYLIQEGKVSPGDGLPMESTQIEGKKLKLFRPSRPTDSIWLQPCEVYKTNYKKVGFINGGDKPLDFLQNHPLADQQVTSFARDEEASRRNIVLCAELAQKYNYRVSVQLHKILGLP
jgi:7-carboxy-7-deazaguanine synthase